MIVASRQAPVFHLDSERESDAYVAKLEALLDRGILPSGFLNPGDSVDTPAFVADVIRKCLIGVSVPGSDQDCLKVLHDRVGGVKLSDVNCQWVED